MAQQLTGHDQVSGRPMEEMAAIVRDLAKRLDALEAALSKSSAPAEPIDLAEIAANGGRSEGL